MSPSRIILTFGWAAESRDEQTYIQTEIFSSKKPRKTIPFKS